MTDNLKAGLAIVGTLSVVGLAWVLKRKSKRK